MDRLNFVEGEGPMFFKFILEATIREEKIKLPRKFVRLHGHEMPSTVTLEIPTGASWQVELVKDINNPQGREFWFDKGWKEFVEDLSLEHGCVVLFKYDEAFHFHVVVCDTSGVEIRYPTNGAQVMN